jgi:cardiolipin synthase A/B
MSHVATFVTASLALYALATGVFIIMENRRPQATMAWMLVFFFVPGIGLLVYIFFGRDRKAFSKQSRLLMQDLEADARPILSPILSRQDAEIARIERGSASRRKLMMLVRHNSRSALTRRNTGEILQDAAEFYPRMMEDMRAARHSIHLQYFIWGADEFTEQLKQILTSKAQAGIEVRLLYDPLGSRAHLSRAYVKDMTAGGSGWRPPPRSTGCTR